MVIMTEFSAIDMTAILYATKEDYEEGYFIDLAISGRTSTLSLFYSDRMRRDKDFDSLTTAMAFPESQGGMRMSNDK